MQAKLRVGVVYAKDMKALYEEEKARREGLEGEVGQLRRCMGHVARGVAWHTLSTQFVRTHVLQEFAMHA